MTTKIIAFSGYKQCGKNTCCEFLTRNFRELWPLYSGQSESLVLKTYSFADKIKQFCQECLGLTHEQVWGSEADKNTLTALRWEDMPRVISNKALAYSVGGTAFDYSANGEEEYSLETGLDKIGLVYHEKGLMTARAVMQFFGTEIGRKMYTNIWSDACIRQIKKDNLPLALICDMRFPSEFEAVKAAEGITIRLTRQVIKGDLHASETSLDPDKFDWNKFDIILKNDNWSVAGQNKELVIGLKAFGVI